MITYGFRWRPAAFRACPWPLSREVGWSGSPATGSRALELAAPATPETVYEIGSISKQFTATAILLLVEDAKLSLDDPLSKFVAGAPPSWAPITIRHVLSHTTGLADFDTGQIGFSYCRNYTGREFVDLLARQPLQFTPGSAWAYTNAFPLLGMVVEQVSGQPYTAFVQTRIFDRLGLASARFKRDGDVVPHRADGYLLKDDAYRHGEPARPQVIAANGGVMMNVRDFAAWDLALTAGRLLSRDSLTAMTTPVVLTGGRTMSHGLGWFMDTFDGHEFGAHWGTTVTGHSAVIRRYVISPAGRQHASLSHRAAVRGRPGPGGDRGRRVNPARQRASGTQAALRAAGRPSGVRPRWARQEGTRTIE